MPDPNHNCEPSQNATKHGLCSNRLILPDEDEHEWLYLKQGWLDDYPPQCHASLTLVLQAAEAQWLFLRARRRYNECEQKISAQQRDPFLWTDEQQKTIDRFTRYRTTYERAFNRAFKNLEDLRRSRSLENARFAAAQFRAQEIELKREKASQPPAPPSAPRAPRSPKKTTPPLPLEQWVQVTVVQEKTVTKLYPPNDVLIKKAHKMDPPPELVYRRFDFVNGIPPEYHWTALSTPELFETGGAGIQRMTFQTWLEVIECEAASGTGHIGPTGVGNLPRPLHRGGCECHVCSHNSEILDRLAEPQSP
jgi:hypothetical protein